MTNPYSPVNAEGAEFKAEAPTIDDVRNAYKAGAASRQGEVDRLRAAANRYGGHDALCEAYFYEDRVCDCGWDEARS